MIRDYTEQTYERLCEQVDQINAEKMSPIEDQIGDIFHFFQKWIHLLKLDDDMKNATEYHKAVLDMRDTTKAELEKIFQKVDNIDQTMSTKVSKLNNRQVNYNSKLAELCKMIHPGWKIESVKTIREQCKIYNSNIEDLDEQIAIDYDVELKSVMKREAMEGVKGTLSGAVKLVVDIYSLPAKWTMALCTKGPSGMAKEALSDTWGLINEFFSAAGNISGLAGIGIVASLYFITGNSSIAATGVNGLGGFTGAKNLYDTLEAGEKLSGKNAVTSLMKETVGTIDNVDAVASLVGDAKDLVTEGKGILPENPIKHTVLRKADMVEKAKNNYSKWQKFYNRMEKDKNIAVFADKIYSLGEALFDMNQPGGVIESMGKSLAKESKLVSRIMGFDDMFHIEKVY